MSKISELLGVRRFLLSRSLRNFQTAPLAEDHTEGFPQVNRKFGARSCGFKQ